ncbi:MAG: helix-turn-helix transcriptional regulator [Planctomycetes bacterium]|nr:helix-turn-helix transcriptional regulator [Planctomycetota bacterium]
MIRSDAEHQEALERLRQEKKRLSDHEQRLKGQGLNPREIKRVMDPLRSFHLQLKEEVESYERLQRRDFEELKNFHGLGRLLVALRIARGLTQRELAAKLDFHESQVSRDERNEYHGITVDRASRILDALGAEVVSEVRFEPARTG